MKRLTPFVFIIAAFLFISGCGTPPPLVPPEMGTVTGYITDGQGGPAVAGATVSCQTYTTTTDAQGYFSLAIEADEVCDLFVTKQNRATTRLQNLLVGEDQTLKVTLPNRARFNPNWSVTAPVIAVSGVNVANPLNGVVTFHIDTTASERNVNKIYAYFGGEQRAPRNTAVFDYPIADCAVDTALYPNGATYLRVLVYDDNENATVTYIPVLIDNPASENAPGDLPALALTATSFGVNVGYYSAQRAEMYKKYGLKGNPYIIQYPEGGSFDLKSAPPGTLVVVAVAWAAAPNATCYRVERSLDSTNWQYIGVVSATSYNDYSPYVSAGQEIWYRVTPLNNAGTEGVGRTRSVTPLSPYNVMLEEPYDKSTNVPLQPTFTWRFECPLELPDQAAMRIRVRVFDVTNYIVFQETLDFLKAAEITELQCPGELEPGHTYSWDIYESFALVWYQNDGAAGYSRAYSYAGEMDSDTGGSAGSLNGEHMFTTVNE